MKMAKKEITRGVFNIGELVANVGEVNKKLTNKEEKEIKDYNIYFYTDELSKEKFDKTFAKYILCVKNLGTFPKKMFFRLILKKYKEYLKEKDMYLEANPSILKNLISKSGRRTGKTNSKSILFGTYQDDTLNLFQNIAYSIAQEEQMKNINDYKKEYFFLIILDYFIDNIEKFIKEANK